MSTHIYVNKAEYLQQIEELASLRAENERLSECCTRRGARMQTMRDWMSKRGIGPPSEWCYFCEERPEAYKWFDVDGVPVEDVAKGGGNDG